MRGVVWGDVVKKPNPPEGYVWCPHKKNEKYIPEEACINMQRGYAPYKECKNCKERYPKGE